LRKGERGIWQRRFWKHQIRDDEDLQRHVDYVHINPVKHAHAGRASDWPYSSIHRYIRSGELPADWALTLRLRWVASGRSERCWGSQAHPNLHNYILCLRRMMPA
jgi:hypothetical protein